MKILLKSATIIAPNSVYNNKSVDILIENGIIQKIDKAVTAEENTEVLEFENLHVSVGWFDSSVCFGDPGFEERETIENGLHTAAKSGFTAVAVNPNTHPVADNKSTIEFMISKANDRPTDLHPIGCFSKGAESKDLAELFDMQNSGAVAFGDYNKPVDNANLLKIGLLYAQNFEGLIMSFPLDSDIAGDGLAHEEENSTRLGLKGIPAMAEEMRIARDLFLLEYTGGKLHIPTISTQKSVALIKEAKKNGLDVTCSVSAHHLVLTDKELAGFDANTKVIPPLRTKEDNDALIAGLEDGTIDMITSDHNPMDVEHKKVEYQNAKFGSIGLETLFGALAGKVRLDVLISCLTSRGRSRFNLKDPSIQEGEVANLTLFNPDHNFKFTTDQIVSKSKNSIFLNKELNGIVYGIIKGESAVLNTNKN